MVGLSDLSGIPRFATNWRLSDGSGAAGNTAFIAPAINADTSGATAASVGYLGLNPYAQTGVQVLIAGANGFSKMIVTPTYLNPNAPPATLPTGTGLQVTASITVASASGGEQHKDLGDGSYEVTVKHGIVATESASVTVSYAGAGAGASTTQVVNW